MIRRTPQPPAAGWTRYVALGDSFTEGTGDPALASGSGAGGLRGWADRLAEHLDTASQVLDEQLPLALAGGADPRDSPVVRRTRGRAAREDAAWVRD